MNAFRNLLRRVGVMSPGFDARLAPDIPFVAIGDIHGRDDLLTQMLDRVPDLPIVFVGDYIDRGPDSMMVLDRLQKLSDVRADDVVCLMGNHEAMLLDFLDHPEHSGAIWLSNGGSQTLRSFGVSNPGKGASEQALVQTRDQLLVKMGDGLVEWLRNRPYIWRSGNIAVTHAGANPRQKVDPSRGHNLLWGHPDFLRVHRTDGLWVVHGHFIVPVAQAVSGRIAIDTGAFKTGFLSAAVIEPGNLRFIST